MRKLLYLLIFVFSLIFAFSLNFSTNLYAEEEYISGKILSLVSESPGNKEEGIEKVSKFKVKILNGEDKGKIIDLDFPTYIEKQYNLNARIGDKVVLYKSLDTEFNEDDENQINTERIDISDIDKRNIFYILFVIFIGLTLLIAKKNGLKSLLALISTLIFIIKFFIPFIAKGYSPILLAVITCIFSTVVTIFFITGISKKSFVAIFGTISGVFIAGILSHIFGKIMRLTGYSDAEVLSYSNIIANIDLRGLVSAGVIIGSLGAVMDVSVSISSSINELYENNPKIKARILFKSAMNIGNDIIGTMINTLVLAYIGSSILTILLVHLQSAEYPLIRVLNAENIAIEVLRAICGSIGILVSVPLTSYIGTKIYKNPFSSKS